MLFPSQAFKTPSEPPWWVTLQRNNTRPQHRILQEEVYGKFIDMPLQHRLLPLHPAFFAICAIIKVPLQGILLLVGTRRLSSTARLIHTQDQHHEDIVEWLVHHVAVGVGHFYMYVVACVCVVYVHKPHVSHNTTHTDTTTLAPHPSAPSWSPLSSPTSSRICKSHMQTKTRTKTCS